MGCGSDALGALGGLAGDLPLLVKTYCDGKITMLGRSQCPLQRKPTADSTPTAKLRTREPDGAIFPYRSRRIVNNQDPLTGEHTTN
jgi:hypothetical protein